MSNQEILEKAQSITDSINRVLNIVAGLVILGALAYVSSMTENPLHPTNNIKFGLFIAVLGLAGLYWLITGIKPGLKITNLRN